MTEVEWVVLLDKLISEDERHHLLLMLSDEDWVSEEGREFLRQVADSNSVLRPAALVQEGDVERPHWYDNSTVPAVSNDDINRSVPSWVLDYLGRVDHSDRPDPKGKFSRYYESPAAAYDALLRALAAGPKEQ